MPLKPLQAARAAFDLVVDPMNYNAAMRFGEALHDWPVMRRVYERMIAGTTAAERDHLRELTLRPVDLDALERLPANTFGHAVARFMRENALNAQAQIASYPPMADALERDWILRRFARAHDFHHVLADFEVDPAAEIGLQVFDSANFGEPYGVLALLSVPVVIARYGHPRRTLSEVWRGIRLGRGAHNLMTAPLEDRFAEDLGEVRRSLGLPDPAPHAG